MMTASVGPGDGSQIGKPSVLFDRRYVSCCPGLPEYDVAPDDRTFFMLQDAGELAPPQLKLVLHWADELGRTIGATGR